MVEISQNYVAFSEYMNFKRQIGGKDFVNFRGLLRKYELYYEFLFQIHDLCYETNGTSSLQMKKRCDEMFWWNIMQLCPPSFSLGIGIKGDN